MARWVKAIPTFFRLSYTMTDTTVGSLSKWMYNRTSLNRIFHNVENEMATMMWLELDVVYMTVKEYAQTYAVDAVLCREPHLQKWNRECKTQSYFYKGREASSTVKSKGGVWRIRREESTHAVHAFILFGIMCTVHPCERANFSNQQNCEFFVSQGLIDVNHWLL